MYTVGTWIVKSGHEDEFARRWQESADSLALEFPDLTFRLLRDTGSPRRYLGIAGAWRSPQQIDAARSLPSFEQAMEGVDELLVRSEVATFELVAEVS